MSTAPYVEFYNGENHTLEEVDTRLSKGINGSWLVITGIGIIMMQVGFMALEVGHIKAKHVRACLFKTIIDHSVGALAWFCVGWSLFIGSDPFAAGSESTWFYHDIDEFPRLFQQYGFAVTASTLVSGSVLSRCRLEVYIVFSIILGAVLYPVEAHWAWTQGGFLHTMGVRDFAGSGVVHLFGGACALTGAAACGPRVGRFGEVGDGGSEASDHMRRGSEADSELHVAVSVPFRYRIINCIPCCRDRNILYRIADIITLNSDTTFRVREQPGHSAPFQVLGGLLLYVAWFSFNAGSSGGMSEVPLAHQAGRAAVNTMLGAASGTTFGLLWNAVFRKHYDLGFAVNCMLGGLVAVTGPCGYVDPWAGIVVGMLAVPVYAGTSSFVLYGLRVDDPLDAVAVHMGCGALGMFWVGLADFEKGAFITGETEFLRVQVIALCAIAAWGLGTSAVYFFGLRCLLGGIHKVHTAVVGDSQRQVMDDAVEAYSLENPITYSRDHQLVGLDYFHFGGSGFPDFDVEAVAEYNATQRIKKQFEQRQAHMTARKGSVQLFEKDASVHRGKHVSTPTNANATSNPAPLFPKKPSEQVVVVDDLTFAMDNPSMTHNHT